MYYLWLFDWHLQAVRHHDQIHNQEQALVHLGSFRYRENT